LLTGKIGDRTLQVHRRGIWISKAVVAEPVELRSAEIQPNVYFSKIDFKQKVSFRDTRFQRHLLLSGSCFEKGLDCHRLKVGINLFCRGTIFKGSVDFRGADIFGQFIGLNAEFLHKQDKVTFHHMKVGQGAIFRNATFHGPVDFSYAYSGGMFDARRAKFKNTVKTKFEGLRVENSAVLDGAEFVGAVALNRAHLLDLKMGGKLIQNLNLDRTRIDRELEIKATTINKITGRSMLVRGLSTLEKVCIKNAADLRDASFQSLDLLSVSWPIDHDKVWIEGLTYKAISAGPRHEDWPILMDWINGTRFNTQPYTQMEAYFKACGHKDRADEIFFAMKRREEELAPDLWPMFKNVFLRWTVGYGRRPWRALAWSAICMCFGIWMFWNQGDMAIRRGPENSTSLLRIDSKKIIEPNYDPVMYSLDLLLPIDLGVAKQWEPNPEWRFGWYYSKIQIMMGWLFITVLLAALTGIIK
jgi:uncharacterized protein YjbI with pentapeptide repeats